LASPPQGEEGVEGKDEEQGEGLGFFALWPSLPTLAYFYSSKNIHYQVSMATTGQLCQLALGAPLTKIA
jgi:hypothetical protein